MTVAAVAARTSLTVGGEPEVFGNVPVLVFIRVSLRPANERDLRRAANTRASICSSTSRLNDDNMTVEHEHNSDFRMRSRRTKSVTRAEEIQKVERMVRRSQPDKPWVDAPMHT